MKKLSTAKSPVNGISAPGSQMGVKSKAVLELLRKGRARNRLDIEMLLGYTCGPIINRLIGANYIKNGGSLGANCGLYEITNAGRIALGEALSLKTPSYAPICPATIKETYIPSIHGISRVGIARS